MNEQFFQFPAWATEKPAPKPDGLAELQAEASAAFLRPDLAIRDTLLQADTANDQIIAAEVEAVKQAKARGWPKGKPRPKVVKG